jgi:hypothetical protein
MVTTANALGRNETTSKLDAKINIKHVNWTILLGRVFIIFPRSFDEEFEQL